MNRKHRWCLYSLVAAVVVGAYVAQARSWSTKDYVQDGLVFHLDALDNRGTGVHDAGATAWKCLKTGKEVELAAGESFSDDAVSVATSHTVSELFGSVPDLHDDRVARQADFRRFCVGS